jgi:hypothetical protein
LNPGDVFDRDCIDAAGAERRDDMPLEDPSILARRRLLPTHIDVSEELRAERRNGTDALFVGGLTSGIFTEFDARQLCLRRVSR